MIRGKFNQARCPNCHSWHFAIQLDENLNPEEFKCCRCQTLFPYKPKIAIKSKKEVKQ
jgi:NAD-dependent SIR2 family protein deacetylase